MTSDEVTLSSYESLTSIDESIVLTDIPELTRNTVACLEESVERTQEQNSDNDDNIIRMGESDESIVLTDIPELTRNTVACLEESVERTQEQNSDNDDNIIRMGESESEESCNRCIRNKFSFSNEISDKLNKFREDKTFCDVILRSGLRDVYAHRIILATVSDYFTLLFKYEGGFDKPLIVLDENMVTGDCLENIVSFAYTGKIDICDESVCDLLMAADYLDIPFIKSECEDFLIISEINLDNISNFIWMACHYNLTFLRPICKFVSQHFAEISETVLLNLQPHCLSNLLKEKDLTVLYNDIPADGVEFELFKLVVKYINKYDLSDQTITGMLRVIRFSEIASEELASIVKSAPQISDNEVIIAYSNSHALPSSVERKPADNTEQRKFSRAWKHIHGLKEGEVADISLDDRISKIKIYTLNGIPSAKTSNNSDFNEWHLLHDMPLEDVEDFSSVKGISLKYRSGANVIIGDTDDEATFPLDEVYSQEFTLGDNEVIVKISIKINEGLLKSIKFVTNVGNINALSTTSLDHYSYRYHRKTFSPQREYGYFHSFGKDSTIDSLHFLWVEYRDPILRQYLDQELYSIHQDQDYTDDYDDSDSDY